jgi:N-succinyldiaminopimelate aminotransferase
MREVPGGVCPLHVGDTWMAPFEGGRMQDLSEAAHPGMHRYCDTQGLLGLREALAAKLRERNALDVEPDDVLVTAGATGALSAALGAILAPGDEVLVLAPFWPLSRGIVEACRGVPVEVPFYDRVDSAASAVAAIEARTTPRTVAAYVSTPSNPTGRVLPGDWLEAIAAWARRRDVWLLSDEVYEDYVYRGEHVSLARFAPERTLSTFSFSKAYGMAGNRVGYLAAPRAAIVEALKIATHTFYAAPTAAQLAAQEALAGGHAWVARARELYRAAGDASAQALGLPPAQGSTFHFFDVASKLDDRGLWGFLEDCVGDGFALAPGPSCGRDYATWVRLCYTAAPPDDVAAAVAKLAKRVR